MLKLTVFFVVLVLAALIMSGVSAAPRDGYFEQDGNKYWCYVDAFGCWITGETGEHEYIMFWTEASRELFMGPDSDAPIGGGGEIPGFSELPLKAVPPLSSNDNSPPPAIKACDLEERRKCIDTLSCDCTETIVGKLCTGNGVWDDKLCSCGC